MSEPATRVYLFDLERNKSTTISLKQAREFLRIARADELIPDLSIHRHPVVIWDGAHVAVGNSQTWPLCPGGAA